MTVFILWLSFIGRCFTAVGEAFKTLIPAWKELKAERAKAREEELKEQVAEEIKEAQNGNTTSGSTKL